MKVQKLLSLIRQSCERYEMIEEGDKIAVGVSGGKDSHFQVYMLKEVMRMNPILFSVEDNFPMTEAGKHNLKKHQRGVRLHHHQLQAQHQSAKDPDARFL